jgi:hypothetical protein
LYAFRGAKQCGTKRQNMKTGFAVCAAKQKTRKAAKRGTLAHWEQKSSAPGGE